MLDETAIEDSWTKLAAALCPFANMVAVDLMSDMFKATWGTGNPRTDWDLGAQRLGNHALVEDGAKLRLCYFVAYLIYYFATLQVGRLARPRAYPP